MVVSLKRRCREEGERKMDEKAQGGERERHAEKVKEGSFDATFFNQTQTPDWNSLVS